MASVATEARRRRERTRELAKNDPAAVAAARRRLQRGYFRAHAGGQENILASEARFRTLAAGRRWGKALRLDQPIRTTTGWRAIGDLVEGDAVIGSDGKPALVSGVYPQGIRPMYEVEFSGGEKVICDPEHLWSVRRRWRAGRKNAWETHTLQELIDLGLDVQRADGRTEHRWAVPIADAVDIKVVSLPLAPYLVGALLGDGCLGCSTPSISSVDAEVIERAAAGLPDSVVAKRTADKRCPTYILSTRRGAPNPLLEAIRALGIDCGAKDKHVPDVYLHSSRTQRLDILRGLMDTDGWLESARRSSFASASRSLTEAVAELVESLGGRTCAIQQKKTTHLDSWIVRFYMPDGACPFGLKRKASRWTATPPERLHRKIIAARPV